MEAGRIIMKFNLYTVALAVVLTVTTGTPGANAAERDKINPWLDCGIGAMIFPDENLEVGAGISMSKKIKST
ncbi:MAG: hypothetical protein HKO01_04930 [Flaviramulus sp.]|nr:hypothetical protein [Flaviramulus sp.]NNC49859.1 hypothetical protein [Flaviramulus sp.]